MQITKQKILRCSLPIALFVLFGMNVCLVVAADDQLLDPTDPNNYVNSYLKMTGNYTIDISTIQKHMLRNPSFTLPDNYLGRTAEGDYVFSFDFSPESVSDELSENTVPEYSEFKALHHVSIEPKYILSEDINYLVENLTDIDSGETFFYGPTSPITLANYPYLWIPNIYSASISANTTIIIKSGATSTTIFNKQLRSGTELWFDLTEEFTPSTMENLTISNSIIDKGVFLYSLDSSKELKDTRYLNSYVLGDSVSTSTAGIIGEIISEPATFARSSSIPAYHVVKSWGNKELLEQSLLEKIALIDDLIDSSDDIKDYAVSTAKIINSLPDVAFSVAKSLCDTIAEKTTEVRDFCVQMEADTIAASEVTVDDPSDTFDDVKMSWWEWFKQNTENCWDITKAGIAAIRQGDTQGEWGVDVYNAVINAQGEIENAPTCLQTLSEAMYKSIAWYMQYWKITVPVTAGLALISIVGAALWIGKRFL